MYVCVCVCWYGRGRNAICFCWVGFIYYKEISYVANVFCVYTISMYSSLIIIIVVIKVVQQKAKRKEVTLTGTYTPKTWPVKYLILC